MRRVKALTACRPVAVRDRRDPDTRPLPSPPGAASRGPSPTVSQVPLAVPRGTRPKSSAPSRPLPLQRLSAADARAPSPRTITHGSHPKRVCQTTVDACPPSPQMITHGSYPMRACQTTVDARAYARMISRSAALLGSDADARVFTRRTARGSASDAAILAAEGALAHPHNTLHLS